MSNLLQNSNTKCHCDAVKCGVTVATSIQAVVSFTLIQVIAQNQYEWKSEGMLADTVQYSMKCIMMFYVIAQSAFQLKERRQIKPIMNNMSITFHEM